MRKTRALQSLFSLATVFLYGPVLAAPCQSTNPGIPDIKLQIIAKNIDHPVAITHAGDGSGRLFVLEQDGRVRVIKNQTLHPRPFLDIRDRVIAGGEKGLLGIAFHPQFKTNRRFYLNYTTKRPTLTTIVAEYRVDKQGVATANSERILLTIAQPWGNHNGGQLAFGADGYLYIAMGDGGSGDDPTNNGQNISTLLGTILRIDVNSGSSGKAYAIPGDNPFLRVKNARPEIWAWGLRNPWRFSFDRLTGDLYAADVGQDDVEEINIIEKGKNYGWRIMEGPICTPGVNPDCQRAGLTLPIYSYRHDKGASITGGYVYRGRNFPELCGTYLYGDFVSQAIWGLRVQNGKVINHKTLFSNKSLLRLAIDYFRDDGLLVSTFGEDEAGEVYVAAYQSGRIYKIVRK
ncbi:MAG: PQQ-dependent sugar dehydrogenase [Acidiferrobacterales bacterium]